VFGENLSSRRAEKTDLFRKLNSFGIGSETSNSVDDLLVYGADDPDLRETYKALVLVDPVYGGTPAYSRAQRAYSPRAGPLLVTSMRRRDHAGGFFLRFPG
jgi:hypothetical protein